MKPTHALSAILAAALAGSIPALGADVGRFAVVQNKVTTQKPGAKATAPAAVGATVVVDEVETTGDASAAKLTFGQGAVISLGQNTTFKVSGQAVADATGASSSLLDLAAGKARVFVSRFWSGRPEVKVTTPSAVVGIKGSEVVVEVGPKGETLVSVLGGSARVESKGAPTDLSAGQQARFHAGGRDGDVKSIGAGEIAVLRKSTEADPDAPRQLASNLPLEPPPATGVGSKASDLPSRLIQNTEGGLSKGGAVWQDPATGAFPTPPDSRSSQIGK